jgi:hypothetical protein
LRFDAEQGSSQMPWGDDMIDSCEAGSRTRAAQARVATHGKASSLPQSFAGRFIKRIRL